MGKRLIVVALMVALLMPVHAQSQQRAAQNPELSAREIAKLALPSVGLLLCDDPDTEGYIQGSGFFIMPGILITNYHVIRNNKRGVVQIADATGKKKQNFRIARVVAYDPDSDLALLSIPGAKEARVPVLTLGAASAMPEIGQNVYALGNPEGLLGTISSGIVSGNLRSLEKKARLQITAPISHGSSGGPVVDGHGKVIGVAVGSLSEGQNLNFAVPLSLINDLVNHAFMPTDFENMLDGRDDRDGNSAKTWQWSQPPTFLVTTVTASKEPVTSIIGPLRLGETREVASLRKLSGIYILIEDMSPDAKKIISERQLQTDIELRLRQSGIKVLSEKEWIASNTAGYLYIDIGVIQNESGVFSYSYSVSLMQGIRLERDSAFKTQGETWSRNNVGYAGSSVARTVVRDHILEVVNAFCNDFLKANSQ